MKNPLLKFLAQRGFTLVELMVTLVISSLIAAALYSTYIVQQRSYNTQSVVNEMQQNVRVAMDFLVLDLRMAGYDPKVKGLFGITAANSTSISFTADMDEDGAIGSTSTPEVFEYKVEDTTIEGLTIPTLKRSATNSGTSNYQPMADYIEAIEFIYYDEDGNELNAVPLSVTDREKVRSVKLSVLARASKPDNKFTTTADSYTFASGTTWPDAADPETGDHFRRRLILTQVDLRNMGLN